MKVNLQKIIIFMVVFNIYLFPLCIVTFAYNGEADYIYTNAKELYVDTTNLCNSYSNGDISYDDLVSGLTTVVKNAALSGLDYEVNKVTRLINTLNRSTGGIEHGGGSSGGSRTPVTDLWNDVCNKNNVPTETTQTSTMDMHGYGACIRYEQYGLIKLRYCRYIVISDGEIKFVGPFQDYTETTNIWYKVDNSTFTMSLSSLNILGLYGDVRYSDGSKYPTDDEFIVGTIHNFDQMSEKELEELIDDFYEEMERENPDLSSIEGLLNSIYFRLGKLDSDNDNQLLSEILTAIKAIKSTETDNTELLDLLEEIKNALVFNDGEDKETFSEQLKKIIDNQITRDDFIIDEDLYNNHGEILKERLLGKFSFIYNMKTFVEYCFDEYSNTSESPEFNIEYNGKSHSINFSVFDEHLPTIQWILAAFVYLTYAYHTYRKIPSYINGGDNE